MGFVQASSYAHKTISFVFVFFCSNFCHFIVSVVFSPLLVLGSKRRQEFQSSSIILLHPPAVGAVQVVASSAAHASLAAPPSSSAGASAAAVAVITAAADANAEEDRGDEQGGPTPPAETEGIPTQARIAAVRQEHITHADEDGRHEGDGDSVEEESDEGREAGDGGAQAAEAGDKATEEGQDGEDEGDEVEDPAEAPHVVVIEAGGVAAVGADQLRGRARGVAGPGPAERRRGCRLAAVHITLAADVEVRPLRDGARARDAIGSGGQEVGLVQRRSGGHGG